MSLFKDISWCPRESMNLPTFAIGNGSSTPFFRTTQLMVFSCLSSVTRYTPLNHLKSSDCLMLIFIVDFWWRGDEFVSNPVWHVSCFVFVTTEDVVKGDKHTHGFIENAVMPLRGIIRPIECHMESSAQDTDRNVSPVLPWLVEHAGNVVGEMIGHPVKDCMRPLWALVCFSARRCSQGESPLSL